MSITETFYRPTIAKVEKKNTKYVLASCIIDINKIVDKIDNEDVKKDIIKILLRVL